MNNTYTSFICYTLITFLRNFFARFLDWMPKLEDERICCDEKTFLVIKCVHEMQEITGMNLMAAWAGEVMHNGRIEELLLTQLDISPMECTALFEFLRHTNMKNLHTLKITNCATKHFAFCELAKLLLKDNEITLLVINKVGLTDEDAKHSFDTIGSGPAAVVKSLI